MLVSIDKTSRTLPAPRTHRAFVINFLKEGAEDVATLFTSKAEVTESREAGDRILFRASVEAGEALVGTPLTYYRRIDAAWPEERPAPPVEGSA